MAISKSNYRELPEKYRGITITTTSRGWYASFVVEVSEDTPKSTIKNPIGIDVNSDYTATSLGELIPNPKLYCKKNRHIKNNQRKLSRKKKGSKNRAKQKLKLARIHDQIRCQRLNHIHQLSGRIAKVHDLVSVETLNIENMKRKNKLVAKAIADNGWSMFISALEYKCRLYGNHFIKINKWLPSSKTCSNCGNKKEHLPLDNRTYICDSCYYEVHRDINAAINICNWGLQQWYTDHTGQELPGVPVDLSMDLISNVGIDTATDMKQEAIVN